MIPMKEKTEAGLEHAFARHGFWQAAID